MKNILLCLALLFLCVPVLVHASDMSENSNTSKTSDVALTATSDGEVYNFIDQKTDGLVCVTKEWMAIAGEKEIPDISISTIKPNQSLEGHTVTFDANGGTFSNGSATNVVLYNKSGSPVSGGYEAPIRDASNFIGWRIAGTNTEFNLESDILSLESDITLVAKYEEKDYYAIVYMNGDMVFQYGLENDEYNEADILEVYDGDDFLNHQVPPWRESAYIRDSVSNIIVKDAVAPENLRYWFADFENLEHADVNKFDVSDVLDFSGMFSKCFALSDVYVNQWDVSSGEFFNGMFYGCISLDNIDMSNWCILGNNPYDMVFLDNMFENSALRTFVIDSCRAIYSANQMFEGCDRLYTVSFGACPDGAIAISSMNSMFYGCWYLTDLDISALVSDNFTNMEDLWENCSRLESLTLGRYWQFNYTGYPNGLLDTRWHNMESGVEFEFSSLLSRYNCNNSLHPGTWRYWGKIYEP